MVTAKILVDEFDGKSDTSPMVDIFWGVKDLNKTGGSMWDASFIGTAIMDDKLDASS